MIKNFRFQGLIMVLALFAFYGCGENEPLGLPFEEDNNNINLQYKEFTLPSQMVFKDSLSTANVGRLMSGKFSHPKLGSITATTFGQVNLPSGSMDIPDDAEFDSLVLGLAGSYFYGEYEKEEMQDFAVHQLNDTIPLENHYKFETLAYQEGALGQASFNINPEEDSVFTIRLNDGTGQDLFNKAQNDDPEFESNSNFRNFFKGIALVPGQNNTIMLGFDPESSLTGMRLYYHTDDDTTGVNFSFDGGLYFNNISGDRSGTGLAGKLQDNNTIDPVEGEVFLQSGAGIFPKINFKPLQSFVEANDNQIIINRANLEIGTGPATSQLITPPQVIQPIYINEDNKYIIRQVGANEFQFGGITGGSRNSIKNIRFFDDENAYNTDLTVFSQRVADKNSDYDEIMLAPPYSGGYRSTINHFIADTSAIKLKVYYTTLK